MKKNLYTTKQAAENSFEILSEGLQKEKFIQRKINPSLFLRKNFIVIFYVNDCFIFRNDDDTINELIEFLKRTFYWTEEGDVNAYLGIKAVKEGDGTITMTQLALIN